MTTMYGIKPIINHDINIDRPICMYEMKNINGDGDLDQKCRIVSEMTGQYVDLLKTPLAEVAALEARQEKILGQLAELKQQVLNLCDVLKENNQSQTAVACAPRAPRTPIFESLVMNVNPSRPCFSVLALKAIWEDVDFVVSPFIHSNVKSRKTVGFEKTLSTGKASVINLSLIWKDVIDVEIIVGIHGHVIMGESNFLRYLVRMLDNECYENSTLSSKAIQMDRILDLSHRLIHQQSSKDKQQILSSLHEKLGTNEWFSGQRVPDISDVATWSAMKQSSITESHPDLMTWYKRCDKFFQFQV